MIFGQGNSYNKEVILGLMQLSIEQLYDTANYYYKSNSYDNALICYNLLIKSLSQNGDTVKLEKIMISNFRLATIYGTMSDYKLAQDFYTRALLICEKINKPNYESAIYMNMGSIYHYLNQNEIAKQYYAKSYEICEDSLSIIILLNNMGGVEIVSGDINNALYHIQLGLQISKRHNDALKNSLLNNLASYYEFENQYDSAFHYYRLALHYSSMNKSSRSEAINLSALGKLFFETNKVDSALYYFDLSNKVASENTFLSILADNYLVLSKIKKSKGDYKSSVDHYEKYIALKDSISNAEVYENVNLIQRQYETSKANQQIEELVIDKQINEYIIHFQIIKQRIINTAMTLMGIILLVVLIQNKRLRKYYKLLVDKNIEIMSLYREFERIKRLEINRIRSQSQNVETTNVETTFFENSSLKPLHINPVTESQIQEAIIIDEIPNSEAIVPYINELKPLKQYALKSRTPYFIAAPEIKVEEVEKGSSCPLSEDEQNDLLKRILDEMENTSIVCRHDFTINKLAENLHSNQKYISYVINRALNKNFRQFLNSYRIKEAQKLFLELDESRFSVNAVAQSVGFKSYSGFYYAFKEITGVTPNYYSNSLKKES